MHVFKQSGKSTRIMVYNGEINVLSLNKEIDWGDSYLDKIKVALNG